MACAPPAGQRCCRPAGGYLTLLPPGTGRTMQFTGITVPKAGKGLITEEASLGDGVTAARASRQVLEHVTRQRATHNGLVPRSHEGQMQDVYRA